MGNVLQREPQPSSSRRADTFNGSCTRGSRCRPVWLQTPSPQESATKSHGIQRSHADDAPNLRLDARGRLQQPDRRLCDTGSRREGLGQLVAHSLGHRAGPEGMGERQERGRWCGGGVTARAAPRPDMGSGDGVDGHAPQGFLDDIGTGETPGRSEGVMEGAESRWSAAPRDTRLTDVGGVQEMALSRDAGGEAAGESRH